MSSPVNIRVVGLHPVTPTTAEFDTAREILCGDELNGDELTEANCEVREHFRDLHLIEIEVEPADSQVDWLEIMQPLEGKTRGEWQAPWDERSTGEGRWAFFLHFVQIEGALLTEVGPIPLPAPTPTPPHLGKVKYYMPG